MIQAEKSPQAEGTVGKTAAGSSLSRNRQKLLPSVGSVKTTNVGVPTRQTRVGAWRVTRITDALRLSPDTPPSRCEVHQADENLLGRLELLGTGVVAPSGAILFDQGQPGAGVYVLKSGSASLCLLNTEGATVWSRIVGVGAILGLPSTIGGTPYSLRATVIESVEVVFIPKERLIEVMHQDPALASALLKILSDELIDLRRKLSSGAGA